MNPTLAYQFERNTETAITAALRHLGATAVYESLLAGEFPPREPRLVVESSAFVQASPQLARSRQGIAHYSHYRGTVSFEINTPITPEGIAWHHSAVGLVRHCLSHARGGLCIPPYDVLNVEETAGSIAFLKDGERHRSRLAFALQLAIPPGILDTAAV